jgi:hypothetical protein
VAWRAHVRRKLDWTKRYLPLITVTRLQKLFQLSARRCGCASFGSPRDLSCPAGGKFCPALHCHRCTRGHVNRATVDCGRSGGGRVRSGCTAPNALLLADALSPRRSARTTQAPPPRTWPVRRRRLRSPRGVLGGIRWRQRPAGAAAPLATSWMRRSLCFLRGRRDVARATLPAMRGMQRLRFCRSAPWFAVWDMAFDGYRGGMTAPSLPARHGRVGGTHLSPSRNSRFHLAGTDSEARNVGHLRWPAFSPPPTYAWACCALSFVCGSFGTGELVAFVPDGLWTAAGDACAVRQPLFLLLNSVPSVRRMKGTNAAALRAYFGRARGRHAVFLCAPSAALQRACRCPSPSIWARVHRTIVPCGVA